MLFFPIVLLIYYMIPAKWKTGWLLIASYYFYLSWNVKYIFFILPITIVTYGLALGIYRLRTENGKKAITFKKVILAAGVLLTIGVLGYYKYADFFVININRVTKMIGIELKAPVRDIVTPVGLSFYSFMAVGYLVDVYRGKVAAERNILKYALFLSFFPVTCSGPIERAGSLLAQINTEKKLDVENIRKGLLSLAYGLYLKIVIADNLAPIINQTISDYTTYKGCEIALATVLFGIQIYCDFNGYSQMALGAAKCLGFDITNNFHAPYLAENVKEFWRRWHVSLTSWFRDYVYIPLGGNRRGEIRTYVNLLLVFLLSGLWHGAALNFVFWGGLNGIYLVLYGIYDRHRKTGKRRAAGNRICNIMITFFLVDFAWFFFMMPDLKSAIRILVYAVQNFRFHWLFSGYMFGIFPGKRELFNFLFSMVILFVFDWMEHHNIDYREKIFECTLPVRWGIYFFFVFSILIFGAYGGGYEQTSFIYFDF